MLNVLSREEALKLLRDNFEGLRAGIEQVPLERCCGRILAEDVASGEEVPAFNRSMVDGYALRAADSFGCSETLPSILKLAGALSMGEKPAAPCRQGECFYVPTGGALPEGADAMAMIEHAETYGDGTVGILKAVARGQSVIYAGDDVRAGSTVLRAGKHLSVPDVGALAALGATKPAVRVRPTVGILSTGDELTPPENTPDFGQVRDVNLPMLCAAAEKAGCIAKPYGICCDDFEVLSALVETMARECDIVVLSGGSSVGARDHAPRIAQELGRLLFHGIAMKPGKPALAGEVRGTPFFGLPGHPVAAYFVFKVFVCALIRQMLGRSEETHPFVLAQLKTAIPSNHGREEYLPVRLQPDECGWKALPAMGKSGLITLLSAAGGYVRIPRDCEGLPAGAVVQVFLFD